MTISIFFFSHFNTSITYSLFIIIIQIDIIFKMKCNFNKISKQNLKIEENISNVIRRIAESSPEETFYIFNVEDVLLKFDNWRKNLPLVTPYYDCPPIDLSASVIYDAVKCNPDPSFLRILSILGSCFDCASKNEIERVLSLGVNPSRIIFANPAKLPSHLKYAAEQNVNIVTADGEEEMYKIKQFHPTAEILLRIRSDSAVCETNLGKKFGCNSNVKAPNLLRLARKLKLKMAGICFHVGSDCHEPTAYKRAIGEARLLFDLGRSLGFQMRILDIGGGFPGDKNSSIAPIAQSINEAIRDYFPKSSGVHITAEPGRYFAASAFTLATCIHGKRIIHDEDNGEPVNVLLIPDGIFGSFSDLLFVFASFNPIPLLRDSQTYNTVPTFICGPTNHPLDILTKKIDFPDLHIGDWILFENMGAYKAATARYFSGFPLAKVYVSYNGSILSSLDGFHSQRDECNLIARNV